MAYFNELAGGTEGGRFHLLDSNLDWGQDLHELKQFVAEHPEVEPLSLAYFGTLPPESIGLSYENPPINAPRPGWHAVSVNFVMGRPHWTRDGRGGIRTVYPGEDFRYFQAYSPKHRIGASIPNGVATHIRERRRCPFRRPRSLDSESLPWSRRTFRFAKRRAREFTLLMLVSGMALIANLPDRVLMMAHFDRGIVMAVLGLVILLAVFLYVRMFFFLLYLLLAVGANLPDQWATALNITQGPLLAALITMVAVSLVNYSAKVLPTGLEQRQKRANPEALHALMNAIDRGNPTHVRAVLPVGAVIQGDGHSVVFVEQSEGRFRQTEVSVGKRSGDIVPVLSGIKAGQRVVVDGVMLLK